MWLYYPGGGEAACPIITFTVLLKINVLTRSMLPIAIPSNFAMGNIKWIIILKQYSYFYIASLVTLFANDYLERFTWVRNDLNRPETNEAG